MHSMRSIFGALASSTTPGDAHPDANRQPFITIARQAGAGGRTLKDKLVERLAAVDKVGPAWTGYDRELVEKVAAEHNLHAPLVESLGEANRGWLEELLASLTIQGPESSEFTVYRKVAQTIRALAQAGRVVIVGRGGVFITRDMPFGIHISLVAPLEARIGHMAQLHNLSEKEAADLVRDTDYNRDAFYKRYSPQPITAESFTVTYNTADISDDAIVESVLPLILDRRRPASVEAEPEIEVAIGTQVDTESTAA